METVGAGGSTASRLDEQTPTSYEHPKGYFSPESCLGRIVPLEKRRQIESEINEGVKPGIIIVDGDFHQCTSAYLLLAL